MRSRRASVLPMLMLAVALWAGCERERPVVEKTLLLTLPPDYLEKSLILSHDGRAWAYVTKNDQEYRVVSANHTSDVHPEVATPRFAPKTDRLFYWFRDGSKQDPTVTFVADGWNMPTDFVVPGEMGFSEDGSRWFAAGAARSSQNSVIGEITLFADGNVVARVSDLALPSFSHDGKHLAYLTAANRRVSLVVDGNVLQTFDPPTAECGAAALRAAPQLDLPMRHIVKYFADGTLLVVTRDPDGWGVYVDGQRVASYPRSNIDEHVEEACAHTSTFLPRSVRLAERGRAAFWWERVAGDAEIWRVVRNGKPVDDVTCIQPWRYHPPEPSPDGEQVAYVCPGRAADGSDVMSFVRAGVRYGPYYNVWGIAPTKSFSHVGYAANRGPSAGNLPWAIFVDGEVRVPDLLAAWRPLVFEDGSTVAWQATRDDEGRGYFGIDRRRLGTFDEVYWGPEIEPDDRVAWIIRRGHKITRVTVPLALARTPVHPHAVRALAPPPPSQRIKSSGSNA